MSCSNCGGSDIEDRELCNPYMPNYDCECFECVKCGNMCDFEDIVKLSPGEFACLDCLQREAESIIRWRKENI